MILNEINEFLLKLVYLYLTYHVGIPEVLILLARWFTGHVIPFTVTGRRWQHCDRLGRHLLSSPECTGEFHGRADCFLIYLWINKTLLFSTWQTMRLQMVNLSLPSPIFQFQFHALFGKIWQLPFEKSWTIGNLRYNYFNGSLK